MTAPTRSDRLDRLPLTRLHRRILLVSGAGWASGFGRIASILAPLAVPPLLSRGGVELVFGVLAAFFGLAIVGSLLLPELRGRHLEGTLGKVDSRATA